MSHHHTQCVTITVRIHYGWNDTTLLRWPFYLNTLGKVMTLPTKQIGGYAAGKKKNLLCRCGNGVDDVVYGKAPTLFNIFPFLRGSFLRQSALVFHTQMLTFVNHLEHYIFCRPWLINLSCSSSLQYVFCRSLMIMDSFWFWALLESFESSFS